MHHSNRMPAHLTIDICRSDVADLISLLEYYRKFSVFLLNIFSIFPEYLNPNDKGNVPTKSDKIFSHDMKVNLTRQNINIGTYQETILG